MRWVRPVVRLGASLLTKCSTAGRVGGATSIFSRVNRQSRTVYFGIACSITLHLVLLSFQVENAIQVRSANSSGGGYENIEIQVLNTASLTSKSTIELSELGPSTPKLVTLTVSTTKLQQEKSGESIREGREESPLIHEPGNFFLPAVWPAPRYERYEEFVPRSELSIPPFPSTPIVLESPEGDGSLSRYLGVLSLFIDEQGRVEHISADEPYLPPAFEAAARHAFMTAQFSPGQIDGRAVKSRQRVEVVFDSTPAQSH
jgi:hypothetical protein